MGISGPRPHSQAQHYTRPDGAYACIVRDPQHTYLTHAGRPGIAAAINLVLPNDTPNLNLQIANQLQNWGFPTPHPSPNLQPTSKESATGNR